MQLKKITLCGFKSFADKTEFTFDDGVTVVVGPNGCGKSNIVDAVKWVLGEQSAKSLRGGQMQDVIFNGSSSRKSMGFAQVTLAFANTRGLLGTEMDQVDVTRKLYRSGESEYLLNNKLCRLKDIREMFMDTGIGADAYSIIEQGKVEVLLQASKQDRRAIFEEAAGISKYKARKNESLRKLERTEQNLLRLTDIVEEVQKRLRSIKYQAGKARNYQDYTARLNELRLNQLLAEYYQLQCRFAEDENAFGRMQDELVAVTTEGEKNQTQVSLLEDQLAQAEEDIRNVESQRLGASGQISTLEDRIDMGHRRCDELSGFLEKSGKQAHSLARQIEQLKKEIVTDQRQIDLAQSQLDDEQSQLKERQELRQQNALGLAEARSGLEDEKSGLIDIVRRTAQLHNEINSLDMRRNNLVGQKDRLSDRSGQITEQTERLLTDHAQYSDKRQKIETLLAESKDQLENQKEQLSQLDAERLACSENLAAAKEHRSGLLSREQLLADMEANLEGLDVGTQQILKAKARSSENFFYIKGVVAELIRADVKYAAIVEAALADKAQHLVATSIGAILQDGENLEQLQGRVRIICMDTLPQFHNGFDFSEHPQVKGRLVDLVSVAPDSEPLVWHLLGKTILVDTIDSAVRLAQIAPPGYRWVSLTGEVLEADGTLNIGPQIGQVGLISRKSELRELAVNLQDARDRIGELQNQAEQYANKAGHIEKNLQELRTVVYEANTEKIETRSRLEQLDSELARLKREQPLIVSEMSGLEKQIAESLELQAQSRKSLDDLQCVNDQRQLRIDALAEQIDELDRQDQLLLEQITELKVSLGKTQQRRVALQERIASVRSQYQQANHSVGTIQTDLENAEKNLQDARRGILTSEGRISELFMERQNAQQLAVSLRNQKQGLLERKDELSSRSSQLVRQKEEFQEKLHGVQMQLNENNLRSENIVQRGREELQLDLAEQFSDYQHRQIDFDAVAAEVQELRGKIERLGNINLDAITEQAELEKRHEYLTGQLEDLEESKKQLAQLIAKINRQSRDRFQESFDAIRENFVELFRKLFGGGKADIILEDPENILECGIEIIARPPGKQLQSISLLSGGEKTMTAVALLMAIFKSKPSPFCLLDEVDAALDEANVERFNLVVQEFLKDSQFVIITHSRRTMTIADVIYGITMQEQGVSRKVSVRFAGEDDSDTAVA